MTFPTEVGPPLSIYRAFVVQVHAEADVERGRLMGRVEHVASGQTIHFGTLAELLSFMARVLANLGADGEGS